MTPGPSTLIIFKGLTHVFCSFLPGGGVPARRDHRPEAVRADGERAAPGLRDGSLPQGPRTVHHHRQLFQPRWSVTGVRQSVSGVCTCYMNL